MSFSKNILYYQVVGKMLGRKNLQELQTMADGNQDRVVRNRGRVPYQRGLRTTVPSCGRSAARSHRASFPAGRHNCPADIGRLGSAGSTTARSGPPETPASSGSPAYSQGTGDRDRSCVPDRTPWFFSVLKASFSIFQRLRTIRAVAGASARVTGRSVIQVHWRSGFPGPASGCVPGTATPSPDGRTGAH